MNRVVLIIMCLFSFASSYTIDFYHNPSNDVTPENIRNGQNLYYHSNSDDFTFFGTHKWAVNFIVNDIIELTQPDSFLVNSFSIYLPQAYNRVNLFMQHNHNCSTQNYSCYVGGVCSYKGQPNGNIFFTEYSRNLDQGWNIITLTNSIYILNAWVIIESTDGSQINVSASNGTGLSSYYWDRQPLPGNPNAGSLKSLGLSGFRADFLFNIIGSFSRPVLMIDIVDFISPYSIGENGEYSPEFTLTNNSANAATNVYAKIEITNGRTTLRDSLIVATHLDINMDATSSFNLLLPINEYSQYNVTFETGCEPRDMILLKKTRTTQISVYPFAKPKALLEVFAYTGYNNSIDFIRHFTNFTNLDSVDVVFAFPNSIDPLFSWAALQRSNHYALSGYEFTFFNGDLKNSNFGDPDFYQRQKTNYTLAITDRSFIRCQGFSSTVLENDLLLSFDFSNYETLILNPVQNVMTFHIAIVQQGSFSNYGNPTNVPQVISQFITDPSRGYELHNLSIPNGVDSLRVTIPLYTINLLPGNEYRDLAIFSFIQDKQNKIHYHDIYSLSHLGFPEITQPIPPQNPSVVLFPNPFKTGESINISFINSMKQNETYFSIYNIKGQRLFTRKIEGNSFTISNDEISVSGIYFMKVNWVEDYTKNNDIKKIMILK